MKLKYILTQNTKAKDILEQILPILKYGIIHGKLSQIWIVNKNEEEFMVVNNEGAIEINISCHTGKTVLTKIICLVAMKKKSVVSPFLVILKMSNVNIRKLLFNYYYKAGLFNFKTFKYMMRSFIIFDQRQYVNFTRNRLLR